MYNVELADRVKALMSGKRGLVEKKMFGGVCFMLDSRMFAGVKDDDLIVRVTLDRYDALLKKPHARVMDFTRRPMKGFLFVGPGGVKTDKSLKAWLDEALTFLRTTPAKVKKKKKVTTGFR